MREFNGVDDVLSLPSRLASLPRTNMPDEMDLAPYSSEHRNALAQTALWLAAMEHELRQAELQKGAHRLTWDNREHLRRIYLSLLLEDVCDVLRGVEAEKQASAEYEAAKF